MKGNISNSLIFSIYLFLSTSLVNAQNKKDFKNSEDNSSLVFLFLLFLVLLAGLCCCIKNDKKGGTKSLEEIMSQEIESRRLSYEADLKSIDKITRRSILESMAYNYASGIDQSVELVQYEFSKLSYDFQNEKSIKSLREIVKHQRRKFYLQQMNAIEEKHRMARAQREARQRREIDDWRYGYRNPYDTNFSR